MRIGVFPSDADDPLCTYVPLTGKGESLERYVEATRDWKAKGIQTIVPEWRGQGGSSRFLDKSHGHKTHLPDDETLIEDMRLFLQSAAFRKLNRHPRTGKQLPVFFIAHSKGGQVKMLDGVLQNGTDENIIFLAPMLGIRWMAPRLLWQAVAGALVKGGRGNEYAPFQKKFDPADEVFEGNTLTSSKARFAQRQRYILKNPQHKTCGVTNNWIYQAFRSMGKIRRHAYQAMLTRQKLFPNCAIIVGEKEGVVSPLAIRLTAWLFSIPLTVIPGGRHELLLESDAQRNATLEAIDRITCQRLKAMKIQAIRQERYNPGMRLRAATI